MCCERDSTPGPFFIVALAGGALRSFVPLVPLPKLDKARLDNTAGPVLSGAGMTLVGLATLAFLVWLWRRVCRAATNTMAPREPVAVQSPQTVPAVEAV